jgi:hypothetical protein
MNRKFSKIVERDPSQKSVGFEKKENAYHLHSDSPEAGGPLQKQKSKKWSNTPTQQNVQSASYILRATNEDFVASIRMKTRNTYR